MENHEKIKNIIMQEIGLDVGSDNCIYDQDTGVKLSINGSDVVYKKTNRNQVEFDPYNNKKMMDQLFGYFLSKYSEETEVEAITYYPVAEENGNRLECVLNNDCVLRSKDYMRDALQYADIILQLNGGDTKELNNLDSPYVKNSANSGNTRRNYNGRTNKAKN